MRQIFCCRAAISTLVTMMADIGRRNLLKVTGSSPHGLHLGGGELGDILLPRKFVRPEIGEGDEVDVFVYMDSEDRPVATTAHPLAMAGEFAGLEVVAWHPGTGAFLDWGLEKDLLLPIREQVGHVQPGDVVVVYIMVDERSGRLVATMRLGRHVDQTDPPYGEGECVELVIASETPMGYKAVVNHAHWGLLYRAELGTPLSIGQRLNGYVKTVRPDGKIDLSLDAAGYSRVKPLAQYIMEQLEARGGKLAVDDKSSPETIREMFGASKKAFKQALGALYRKRLIAFVHPGIRLTGRE